VLVGWLIGWSVGRCRFDVSVGDPVDRDALPHALNEQLSAHFSDTAPICEHDRCHLNYQDVKVGQYFRAVDGSYGRVKRIVSRSDGLSAPSVEQSALCYEPWQKLDHDHRDPKTCLPAMRCSSSALRVMPVHDFLCLVEIAHHSHHDHDLFLLVLEHD
jgi:hypothetical protein